MKRKSDTKVVRKPIFVIGAGRSGSTIFHQIIAEHPSVAWLSKLCDLYPDKPMLNRILLEAINWPLAGAWLRDRVDAGECYRFWDFYFRGFSAPCRDLTRDDVTIKHKQEIRRIAGELITNRRDRLLIKITGWPRIGFLKEIFPDAKFIHVIRDGRAVANSLLSTNFWCGWRGPQKWRWGELTAEQNAEWERFGRSFIALAGVQWAILMDATEKAKQGISDDDYMEIRYEDLCTDMEGILNRALQFADLEWDSVFEKRIKKYRLNNKDHKWKCELTTDQQLTLQNVMDNHLRKYGYT